MTKILLKSLAIFLFFLPAMTMVSAQTLATYGGRQISKQEFLKAYSKNNTDKNPTEASYRSYLELYIRYKLKVRAALDLGLDSLPNQANEVKNFRNQVVDSYIKDAESMSRMEKEAFDRGQQDIHLAHIYIPVRKNSSPADTLKAYQKSMEAYAALKKSNPFGEVADRFSEDPSVKKNHGDIGYITVFSLPYELETLAYNTPSGQYSKVYRNQSGYHIFKNLGQRKAAGRIKIAQILFLFPPNPTDSVKNSLKQKADSVYALLENGGNFSELAKKYSGDNLSFQTGGDMPEFGVGKYDGIFETAAFALEKDGQISSPISTDFGYHIIKRLSKKLPPSVNDKETIEGYTQKIMNDPRIELSKKALLQKMLKDENYKRTAINENDLWIYTDSFLQRKSMPQLAGMNDKTILFTFTKKNVTVREWLDYIKVARPTLHVADNKANKESFDLFVQTAAFEYYRNHLEEYNRDFAYQLGEFREGNLLFEIMQRKIWDKASGDSAGLKKYFDAHKEKYVWEPSADAILFTCNSEKAASDIQKKLQTNPVAGWKKLVDSSAGAAQADSGRFELTQLPMAEQKGFASGQFSSMVTNPTDNTVTFAYLVKVYNERSTRSYADARGYVINDYQVYLEDNWIAELKKKYPVTIDEAVLKQLSK